MFSNYVTTIALELTDGSIPNAAKAFKRIWTPSLQSLWTLMPISVSPGYSAEDTINTIMNATLLGHVQEYHPDAVKLVKTFGAGGLSPWDPGTGPIHEGDWVSMKYEIADGTQHVWKVPGTAPQAEIRATCQYIPA